MDAQTVQATNLKNDLRGYTLRLIAGTDIST